MTPKIFYRVANIDSLQGLWYDKRGNFTGLIHTKFDFCKNSQLPMPFDENIVHWLSATDDINSLFHWFPQEDIIKLQEFNYFLYIYESTEYKEYQNHWIILDSQSKPITKITLNFLN